MPPESSNDPFGDDYQKLSQNVEQELSSTEASNTNIEATPELGNNFSPPSPPAPSQPVEPAPIDNRFAQRTNEPKLSGQYETEFSGNTPADKIEINPLRTFKEDVNRTVQKQHLSTSQILVAEQKKREYKPKTEEKHIPKNSIKRFGNKFSLLLSVILISIAIIVGIYAAMNWISGIGSKPTQQVIIGESEFFVVDSEIEIDISSRLRNDIEFDIYRAFENEIEEKVLTEIVLFREEDIEGKSQKTKIPSSSLNNLLELRTPEVFNRSLTDNYLFGFYSLDGDNKPFIIYNLLDFENAFDSVFDWEDTLVDDLREVFGRFPEFVRLKILQEDRQKLLEIEAKKDDFDLEETVSVDGVELVVEAFNVEGKTLEEVDAEIKQLEESISLYRNFIDLVVQNTDTRSVVNREGKVLVYYTFINNDKWLLVADDVEVLREVKRRLREKNLVR
jgi:hypothetical protein